MNDLVEYLKSPYVLGERHASPGELVDQMLSKMKEAADHIEAQNKIIEDMRGALKPFADAVFNDNGDMTTDLSFVSVRHYENAYFVLSKASKSNPNTPERNDK